MALTVALAADHAGFTLKAELAAELARWGHAVLDLGPADTTSVDYPDFALKVTAAVTSGRAALGLLVCGTGTGMSIAANKVPGVRAALCRSEFEARMARAHNDANVLCLGQRVTGAGLALEIARAFLATPFEGGRHAARVEKLRRIETAR
jgi:ribose 5-phosphate isomerase B